MGRRNRRSWEEGEDDYGLERAEKNWLQRRHATKRQKAKDEGDKIIDEETPDTDTPTSPKNDTSSPKNDTCSSSAKKDDKIERMKLKKQRQKERRREKIAAQSAIAAEIQQSRKTEQALRDKLKKEKIRIEDRQSQQQYTSVAMGVKYQDLTIGKGPAVQHRKKVRVSYTLRAKSHTTGKILDSSANFGFRLGKGEVIKGWDIGLQDMRVGGIRRLFVPPSAGYGFNKDVGAGRGADLYFQIELLHVAP